MFIIYYILLFSEKLKLACKTRDEYGLVTDMAKHRERDRSAVATLSDTYPKRGMFIMNQQIGHHMVV